MLKLEPLYKDDVGNRLPVLLDITPDGTHVYEPAVDPGKALGERLRRVFAERGLDFFERNDGHINALSATTDDASEPADDEAQTEVAAGPMTPEDLYKMRMEVLPQLFTSLGEMTHAKELLSLLLSSASAVVPTIASTSTLSATMDEALRKAADVFKSAAESMERGRIRGERGNWGLVPAPLPFGSATGKGADKTSKDFLISYGLEESSPSFRRRAVGHMPTYENPSETLVFPHGQNMRLCISVSTISGAGKQITSQNTMKTGEPLSLDGALRAAQQEIVEQEIFSFLVKEAGNLPTASARVSERLIVIDAAQAVELKFELIDMDSIPAQTSTISNAKCDFIYHTLHALLLRMHGYVKQQRLGTAGIFRTPGVTETFQPPLLLRPVIDLLQYEVFCERIKSELHSIAGALTAAGIPSHLRFESIGGTGQGLISKGRIVHTVRLTFRSPSSLTAHLSQATLTVSSIPQLRQLLGDEVERCLLQRICEVGSELCEQVGGIWFIDLSRCVGRWEGCVLYVPCPTHFSIHCSAFRLGRGGLKQGNTQTYSIALNVPLLAWAEVAIKKALMEP
ncbi:subunit 17 of mediator complex-domain-containing protein [Mycena sp. CBHHK59/15]|nr:subunit 17 of mediator complex-domain-containing protein [Mycena sp. CBHHK59/15]